MWITPKSDVTNAPYLTLSLRFRHVHHSFRTIMAVVKSHVVVGPPSLDVISYSGSRPCCLRAWWFPVSAHVLGIGNNRLAWVSVSWALMNQPAVTAVGCHHYTRVLETNWSSRPPKGPCHMLYGFHAWVVQARETLFTGDVMRTFAARTRTRWKTA